MSKNEGQYVAIKINKRNERNNVNMYQYQISMKKTYYKVNIKKLHAYFTY